MGCFLFTCLGCIHTMIPNSSPLHCTAKEKWISSLKMAQHCTARCTAEVRRTAGLITSFHCIVLHCTVHHYSTRCTTGLLYSTGEICRCTVQVSSTGVQYRCPVQVYSTGVQYSTGVIPAVRFFCCDPDRKGRH